MGFLDKLKNLAGGKESKAEKPSIREELPIAEHAIDAKPVILDSFIKGPYAEINDFIKQHFGNGITCVVENSKDLIGIEIVDSVMNKPAYGEVTLYGQLLQILKRNGVQIAPQELSGGSDFERDTLEFGVANRIRNGDKVLVRFYPIRNRADSAV